jgi:hypothetical protein
MSNKPTTDILPANHYTKYNGLKIYWFIGDGVFVDGQNGITYNWHAWGSCNGRAYQMHALFNSTTRELLNIKVLPKITGQDYYFHQETYDLLTK